MTGIVAGRVLAGCNRRRRGIRLSRCARFSCVDALHRSWCNGLRQPIDAQCRNSYLQPVHCPAREECSTLSVLLGLQILCLKQLLSKHEVRLWIQAFLLMLLQSSTRAVHPDFTVGEFGGGYFFTPRCLSQFAPSSKVAEGRR